MKLPSSNGFQFASTLRTDKEDNKLSSDLKKWFDRVVQKANSKCSAKGPYKNSQICNKSSKKSKTCSFVSVIKKAQGVNISETKNFADIYFLSNKHFICTDFLIFCYVRISESMKKVYTHIRMYNFQNTRSSSFFFQISLLKTRIFVYSVFQ